VSPTEFELLATRAAIAANAFWHATTPRTRSAWANEHDTTEAGAYALVLAAVELAEGLVAVRRAETRTGADYYLAPVGAVVNDLENCLRLEVSGTDKGTKSSVKQRLLSKLDQAARGDSNLPALAGVVGFHARAIMLALLE
jgi:hypothetical protein